MQKEELTQSKSYTQTLYRVLDDHIKPSTIKRKNRTKSWKYGYDEEFDVVVQTHPLGRTQDSVLSETEVQAGKRSAKPKHKEA